MKQLVCIITAILVMMLSVVSASALTDSGMIVTDEHDLPLRNALGLAQTTAVDGVDTVLSSAERPDALLVNAAETEDIAAYLTACMDSGVIPMLKVDTINDAHNVTSAMTATSCKDISAISSDTAVLAALRNRKVLVRTGLIVDFEGDTLTSKQAHDIRVQVRSAPATFCVIASEKATRDVVAELQELALSVWVQVDEVSDTAAFDVQTVRAITAGANALLTTDAAATLSLISDTFVDNTMTRTPLLIGHRGNPSQAPENSLSGFLAAYENGADIFELDVEITSDGEIVVMHDDSIKRTTDYIGDKTVGEMTLKEIRLYHLLGLDGKPTDETVPTLKEVLETFRDKDCRIFIEFKGWKTENVVETMKLVTECDMADRVDVISFNTNLITQTQTEFAGMSTGYLHMPSGFTTKQKLALESLYTSILQSQQVNSSINPSKGVVTQAYLQAAAERGVTVWPWTYLLGENTKAFLLAPDGITTDDVQWAKDMPQYLTASVSEDKVDIDHEYVIELQAITYGGEAIGIADGEEPPFYTVIDGAENVRVENGKLIGEKRGEVTVICGYRAQMPSGMDYVLYTQPITFEVYDLTLIVILVVGGVLVTVVLLAVVIWWIVRKKKTPIQEEER